MLSFRQVLPVVLSVCIVAQDLPRLLACGGTPPPPSCGKTVAMGKAAPRVVVQQPGQPANVPITVVVYVGLTEFPPSSGACPSGPITGVIRLALDCNPPPNASAMATVNLTTGFNRFVVNVVAPPGPPRFCTVRGSVTVTCGTGAQQMIVTALGDTTVCLVEPSLNDPDAPRLDLRHAAGSDEVVLVHAGDQGGFRYEIVNNDLDDTFEGEITIRTSNSSRLPRSAPSGNSRNGTFAISAPVEGDDPPIVFEDDLDANGCVPLPMDPLSAINPTITRRIVVDPGETLEIPAFSRSWGMCADGSCAEITVVVEGRYRGDNADDPRTIACIGSVIAVDTTQPPNYSWSDSGATSAGQSTVDGVFEWELRPNDQDVLHVSSLVEQVGLMNADGERLEGETSVQSGGLDVPRNEDLLHEYHRFEVSAQTLGFIPAKSFFDVDYKVEYRPNTNARDFVWDSFADGLGFARQPRGVPGDEGRSSALAMGTARVSDRFGVDSFFDVTYLVSAKAEDANGNLHDLTLLEVEFIPMEQDLDMRVRVAAPELDENAVEITRVTVYHDTRGFTRSSGEANEDNEPEFRRGDANGSSGIDLADGVSILGELFQGGPISSCRDAEDANDDGMIDLSDATFIFSWLFLGGPEMPVPGPVCGPDPSEDALGCESYDNCP